MIHNGLCTILLLVCAWGGVARAADGLNVAAVPNGRQGNLADASVWTSKTRRVKVATPDGEIWKDITYYKNNVGMQFVEIPAGRFMMGSPDTEEERTYQEGPRHLVKVSRFYMGIYEVTQEQYEAIMGPKRSVYKGAQNPVDLVGWNNATEFCKKLSLKTGMEVRLPTEAEWEYACRAGTTTPFYTGGNISTKQANYNGDVHYGSSLSKAFRRERKEVKHKMTLPVGSFLPNAFGLYDMHGNVWEWCADRYDKDYYREKDSVDPKGPARGYGHVLRGGSYRSEPGLCRSAFRRSTGASARGFRVIVVPQDPNRSVVVVPPEKVQDERAKRWAILIGVNKYEDEAGVGSLKYCKQDMKLLYEVLAGTTGGFAPDNVLLMTGDTPELQYRPSYANIITMVPKWLENAQPGDDVLIVFSGHGVERDGKAYLLPADVMQSNLVQKGISLDLLRSWIADCKADKKILLIDTSHSGVENAKGMSEVFWKDAARGSEFSRLISCSPTQQSNVDEAFSSSVGTGHGVFAYYLAEGLQAPADGNHDGRVAFEEAFRYAFQNTQEWAQNKGLAQNPIKLGNMADAVTLADYRNTVRPKEVVQAPIEPNAWIPETRNVSVLTPEGKVVKEIKYYKNSIGMEFVKIPAGEFMMGSPEDEFERGAGEGPQHRVKITRAFYMGSHEVTQEQYEIIMGVRRMVFEGGANPADLVNRYDAVEFCKKLSAKTKMEVRLPTEAEWEYACRAGTTTPFSAGDNIFTDIVNYEGGFYYGANATGQYRKGVSRKRTSPVGSFPPNEFGLYDMHGNVWEWCSDWYDRNYYSKGVFIDPKGPVNGREYVLRGGNFRSGPTQCRSAYRRSHHNPEVNTRFDGAVGFRVVVVAQGSGR